MKERELFRARIEELEKDKAHLEEIESDNSMTIGFLERGVGIWKAEAEAFKAENKKYNECLHGLHVSLIALKFAVRQGGEVQLETINDLKAEVEQVLNKKP